MNGKSNFGRALPLIAMSLAVAMAACSGGTKTIQTAPPSQGILATSAGSIATPAPTASRIPVTPAPTKLVTPEPKADLQKVKEVVLAWKTYKGSAYVDYQVIVELKNLGTGWAEVSGFDSDYTVLDAGGDVTTTGSFTYEFPKFIGPGETGYLIEDSSDDGVKTTDFASVQVDGRYDDVDAADQVLKVTGIKWHRDAYDGTLTATGFVTSTEDLTDAALAVVCISDTGQILGATWTNLLQNITAGKPKGFETVANTPPLRVSQCAKSLGFAESTE
jgi:hypothetical protein